MNTKTFTTKCSILALLLLLLSQGAFAQIKIEGIWAFERAEYLERSSSEQSYQVKHGIEHWEDLYAYSNCFQDAVKGAIIDREEAIIETLFTPYVGKYFLMTAPSDGSKQIVMQFGGNEDIGKDSQIFDMKYSAPGIMYWVEIIDDNTIAITLRKICSEEGVDTQSAIRCIMSKDN